MKTSFKKFVLLFVAVAMCISLLPVQLLAATYTGNCAIGNHAWNEGEVTTAADRENPGVMTYTCEACGETKTEVIPPTLRFAGAALTLESRVELNFNVRRYLLDDYYTDAYAIFRMVDANGVETVVRVDEFRENGSTNYAFDFTKMAPTWFGDTIYATLYAKFNGVEYVSETVQYSVLKYCTNKLNGAEADVANRDVELSTMLVDLLNYGAASQLYVGYKTDELCNAGLTATQKSWASTSVDAYVSDQAQGAAPETTLLTWKSGALLLEDSVKVMIRFQAADLEGLTIKTTVGGVTTEYPCIITEEDSLIELDTAYTSGDRYIFYFTALAVSQLREPITFTAYKDGVAVSKELTYSVESFAAKNYDPTTQAVDKKLADLVNAMMKYGDAAYAYVNDTSSDETIEGEPTNPGGNMTPWG